MGTTGCAGGANSFRVATNCFAAIKTVVVPSSHKTVILEMFHPESCFQDQILNQVQDDKPD
ncbi:hypothetical protein DU53_06545 [Kosmotoga sp. DU53]|nr:hypothetical protein DU53_06545 [Kosmotoga sp. DU53]